MTVTATAAPIPDIAPFLESFAAIHQAMREDADRLRRAVAHADRRQAVRTVRWFARFRASIEHHHRREDDLIWPRLAERSPDFAADLAILTEDHHALDRSLDRTTGALRTLAEDPDAGRGEALLATAELASILTEHLAREEAAAFGRLSATYTAEEYADLEVEIREGTSLGQLAFEAPWVLDRLPSDAQARVLGDAPVALRALYRFGFRPRYRRLAADALGVS